MNIKITSDSTCDLLPELISENDIEIIPLVVNKGEGTYRDGVDIHPQDIFDHVDAGGAICTTSALNAEEYRAVFSRLSPQYDGIVHITIGSEFSSSCDNARAAAREFPNVRVIDSMNLSTGQGLVVLHACDAAKDCDGLDALCASVEAFRGRVESSFLLDRLDYMAKGGRCSSVQRFGANLLSLKPCIEVQNGKLHVVKKYRGSLERCLRAYISERLSGRDDIERDRLFLTHTPVSEAAMRASREALSEAGAFARVYDATAGCTISCHCGPGTLGLMFVRK